MDFVDLTAVEVPNVKPANKNTFFESRILLL
jgi:hypothetical protein